MLGWQVWKRKRERLVKASGIARIDLVCAPYTWQEIQVRCAKWFGDVAFPKDGHAATAEGLLRVELTGPQLAQLMERMAGATALVGMESAAGKALCRRVYDAAAAVVDDIDVNAADGKPPRPVVLDARHPAG
jgi:hypothetical protein